jgi:hypothetical protein
VSARFRTARGATDPRPVSFVVLGSAPLDSARVRAAEGSAARREGAELVSRAVTADTDFLLAVGGLAAGPTTEPDVFVAELEDFARALFPHCAHVPCYEVLGDREVVVEAWEAGWALGQRGAESAEALFAGAVQNPRNGPRPEPGGPPLAEASYSFDRGPVHVAVLHTGYFWRSHPDRLDHPKAALGQRAGWVRDADLRWLDADLTAAAARGARHAFVVTAVPAFPNGGQVGQGMYWGGAVPEVLERRAELLRLLGAHRVRALIAAGEPSYSRTRVHPGLVPGLARPVWQIVTGGAATAPIARARDVPWANDVARFDLRPHHVTVVVAGDRVIVTATSRAGEPIDRFESAAPADRRFFRGGTRPSGAGAARCRARGRESLLPAREGSDRIAFPEGPPEVESITAVRARPVRSAAFAPAVARRAAPAPDPAAPPPAPVATTTGAAPVRAPAPAAPPRAARAGAGGKDAGLAAPESALYDAESDTYPGANVNGKPRDADRNGFISDRPRRHGGSAQVNDGTRAGLPRRSEGMALAGATLYVADITGSACSSGDGARGQLAVRARPSSTTWPWRGRRALRDRHR